MSKAKEDDDDDERGEGDGREAKGQMSSLPGGGTGVVVVSGTGWPVQDQPVENGVDVGGGASHSDSAWSDIASRRCLRMRPAASASADEGKVVVSGEEEEDSEESEEKELEDIVWREWVGSEGKRG